MGWKQGQRGGLDSAAKGYVDSGFLTLQVCHYMTQPLVELHGGCMVVPTVS